MNRLSHFVSLHPYFKVHPGKLAEFKSLVPEFVEKTQSEARNMFYEFSLHGDEFFCREAYLDADALLAHLAHVDATLHKALKIADLVRLEVHGPANQLDRLREPLAQLKPAWFVLTSG